MKKWIIALIIVAVFSVLTSNVQARGSACNTTQDCYNIYKTMAYTCEFDEKENGSFCDKTKDCGAWTFSGCEGNYGLIKNSCDEIKKEPRYECASCQTDADCQQLFNTTYVSCSINNKCEAYTTIGIINTNKGFFQNIITFFKKILTKVFGVSTGYCKIPEDCKKQQLATIECLGNWTCKTNQCLFECATSKNI